MSFTSDLISWYEANKRELPFRGTKDPYLIWVSEVILQQTRMEQGLGYYKRFVERFPDIRSLASGSEEEVLKLWQGLGYYSRARNLHASAREIVERWGGEFPRTFARIRELKGIGDYSAASIASLAFDEPIPAIDGNVYRFITRYYGFRDPAGSTSGMKKVIDEAQRLMDKKEPGLFNQAMIEFGALVCTPVNPSCDTCIFRDSCYAYLNQKVAGIPVKAKPAKVRKRYFHYLVITFEGGNDTRILINKRKGNDIWKNLYDFPLIETTHSLSSKRLMMTDEWKSIFLDLHPTMISVTKEFRHILSHQLILARFYRISLAEPPEQFNMHVAVEQLVSIPVPRLISRYWQKYFH